MKDEWRRKGFVMKTPASKAPGVTPAWFILHPSSFILSLLLLSGCDLPGKPKRADRPVAEDRILDFKVLYGRNCAGCHGAEGKLGPAPPLNDPLFLSIVKDVELWDVISHGRQGHLMPAFARDEGGPLTEEQVEVLIRGIRARWARPLKKRKQPPPPYSAGDTHGDPAAGLKLFDQACAACHGTKGKGGEQAGPLNNPAFLSLLSDQALRRIVITGRDDLGMPDYAGEDWRSPKFKPLDSRQVADIVALLASWRKRQ